MMNDGDLVEVDNTNYSHNGPFRQFCHVVSSPAATIKTSFNASGSSFSGSVYTLLGPAANQAPGGHLPLRQIYIARVHESVPYHELLGLPYGPNPFVVDAALLKRRFLEAQRICHPDAWATRSEVKDVALELSNAVNAAYKTLTSPLHRIEYILRRNGIDIGEADQLDDVELISEIMEIRDEIDNVQPENAERLLVLRDENNANISRVARTIEDLVDREDWTETKNAAVRLKYLEGIEDAIRRRIEDIM
ncbi:hypothetical protein ID866_2513 [Astraeus odoratus]|nr:hypothetical protein ID866_2513 [Astraeus odoratus]